MKFDGSLLEKQAKLADNQSSQLEIIIKYYLVKKLGTSSSLPSLKNMAKAAANPIPLMLKNIGLIMPVTLPVNMQLRYHIVVSQSDC